MAAFRLRVNPTDLVALARRYRSEDDDVALAAGRRIRAGDCGWTNVEDIFKWKTRGRGISRLRRNSDEEIADALSLAVRAKTERAAVAVLLGLRGVDVPVASAILTVTFPERYTVIDFRALEALDNKSSDRSVNFYLAYLDTCRRLAIENNISLRDLDRALWQWSSKQPAG